MTVVDVAGIFVFATLFNLIIHILAATNEDSMDDAFSMVTAFSGIFFIISLTVFFTLKAVL